MSTEPALMTLTEVAHAIAAKQVSSHEVTRALLHRVAQWQPHLNAFMTVEPEAALKAAAEPTPRSPKARSAGSCTASRSPTRTCITTPARS
jgi:aspartyl-tRNA(Asn)/glutamyl-tRNA(Gln) amidotransferase subunit A